MIQAVKEAVRLSEVPGVGPSSGKASPEGAEGRVDYAQVRMLAEISFARELHRLCRNVHISSYVLLLCCLFCQAVSSLEHIILLPSQLWCIGPIGL